jgi:hypothetical protein
LLPRFPRPLIAIAALFVCLTIHELGHVLAAYLSGGTVQEVVVFSLVPHVGISGTATAEIEAIRAVSGSALSLVFCLAILLAVRGNTAARRIAKDAVTAFACVELTGWSLSSLTQTLSSSPDDAQHFLSAAGVSRFTVVAMCALLVAMGVWLFRVSERRAHPRFESRPQARAAAAK